ncbi:MAG: hypothetical protein HYY60_03040 [Parcubacteria group bacterium]|nr:hypothetical protein [Parcubacteria group bacterium]
MNPEKNPSYIRKLLSFYFARRWQSLLATFYFVVFGYSAVFYLGNLWLSLKFLAYTLFNSAQLLALPYLFWGVLFLVGLLIPFAASMYALILCYEVWNGGLSRWPRVWATMALILAVFAIIVSANEMTRFVAGQEELSEFITAQELQIEGQ